MPVAADNLFAPSYNITTHGFDEWDVLYRSGANAWTDAQANLVVGSPDNVRPGRLGLVVEDTDANNVKVLDLRGVRVELADAWTVDGTPSFGDSLYLSPTTAARMTATKPTSDSTEVVVYLGWYISSAEMFWNPDRWLYLPSEAPDD